MAGGIDNFTKLMLHMNGTDTSTVFTDDSASAHSVTANGNAQIDTAQSVFGGASGLFDGTGDYLSIPDNADFDVGGGDWCVDFRVRFNTVPTGAEIAFFYNQYLSSSRAMELSFNASILTTVFSFRSTSVFVMFPKVS
ncbi:MAG: hypothetical protein IIC75_05850 [Bacteroidetes bacterium]|nr:hypothetical protein [Bacteroidota bacterium]